MTSPISAKLLKSLREKKYRQESKKFLVEGTKNVEELLASNFKIDSLFATKEFAKANFVAIELKKLRTNIVEPEELRAYGTLESNDGAIAIAHMREQKAPEENKVLIALDDIRDPGNLGTIIRIADWYGIEHIICSKNCVDWYNPKVIAATMGSFTRVSGYYTDLSVYLKKTKLPVIVGDLSGESVRNFSFPKEGILVIGSESHGISREVLKCAKKIVTIPRFGKAESLNAGVATAVILERWVS